MNDLFIVYTEMLVFSEQSILYPVAGGCDVKMLNLNRSDL